MIPMLKLRQILPSRSDYPGFRAGWRHDLLAGVAVGVVALPLALAFGISTGTGAASGLVTAIVAGFIAAVFGGSRFQVSGPTGAMTVVLVPIVAKYGVGVMPIIGAMAGLIIILLGIFKLGRYLAAVPWAVLEGFTVGIGIVIALQQLPLALDITKPEGSNAARVAWATLKIAFTDGFKNGPTIILFTAITCMLLSVRFTKTIPASIVTVVFCTIVLMISPLEAKKLESYRIHCQCRNYRRFQRWGGLQLFMRLSLLLHSVPLSQFFQPALRMEWNMRKLIYMMGKNMIQIGNYLVRV